MGQNFASVLDDLRKKYENNKEDDALESIGVPVAQRDANGSVQAMAPDGAAPSPNVQNVSGGSSDNSGQAAGSLLKIAAMCCFIFAEAYEGKIPWYVRASRDLHRTDAIHAGYVWMSRWLVPAMKRFSLVRKLVIATMIRPLTADAAFVFGVAKTPRPAAKRFWLTTWSVLGRIFN